MTDTPPDPQPLTAEEIAALRIKDEWHTPLIARFLATLDARPSGDEALRAHVAKAFDEYLWGLSISPGGDACEASVRYFRDNLLSELAALADPVSPSPDVNDPAVTGAASLPEPPSPDAALEGLSNPSTRFVGDLPEDWR